MTVTILYPAVFGELSSPWSEEYFIAKKTGFSVATFEEDSFKIKSDISGHIIIYRGWMISFDDYKKLTDAVNKKNGSMLIPLSQYRKANSFSNWYSVLNRYSMESYFIRDFSKLEPLFLEHKQFFVKDDLKSLGSKKSIANTAEEAINIYEKIKSNRDFEIENNGICLRKVVSLENEERFFVLNGEILCEKEDNQERRKFVKQVAEKLSSKLNLAFLTVDVASSEGKNILVEVGGFQVSDIAKNGDVSLVEDFYVNLKHKLSLF